MPPAAVFIPPPVHMLVPAEASSCTAVRVFCDRGACLYAAGAGEGETQRGGFDGKGSYTRDRAEDVSRMCIVYVIGSRPIPGKS